MEYIGIVDDIQSFMNTYKYGNVTAKHGRFPNFYVIEFKLPQTSGQYLTYAGHRTGPGQNLDNAVKQATDLGNAILNEIKDVINLEDGGVEVGNRSVILFMVSDEFATNEIFKNLKLTKIFKEQRLYTSINEFKKINEYYDEDDREGYCYRCGEYAVGDRLDSNCENCGSFAWLTPEEYNEDKIYETIKTTSLKHYKKLKEKGIDVELVTKEEINESIKLETNYIDIKKLKEYSKSLSIICAGEDGNIWVSKDGTKIAISIGDSNPFDEKYLEEFIKLYVIKDYKHRDKVEIEIDNEFSYDNNDEYIKV